MLSVHMATSRICEGDHGLARLSMYMIREAKLFTGMQATLVQEPTLQLTDLPRLNKQTFQGISIRNLGN
jgi:hypothetical protein